MAPSPVLSGVCPMHRNSCLQIWVIPAQPAWPLTEQRPGAWQTEAIPSSEDLRMFFYNFAQIQSTCFITKTHTHVLAVKSFFLDLWLLERSIDGCNFLQACQTSLGVLYSDSKCGLDIENTPCNSHGKIRCCLNCCASCIQWNNII